MTPGKYADSYELSAGLRDDTIATIQFATFRTDAGYNNGNTLLLVLTLTDENNEVFDQINNTELDIGEDWTSRMVISPDLLIDLIEHYQLTNQRKANQ